MNYSDWANPIPHRYISNMPRHNDPRAVTGERPFEYHGDLAATWRYLRTFKPGHSTKLEHDYWAHLIAHGIVVQ